MKTIHKYHLEVKEMQSIRTHKGARWLCANDQQGGICVWAEVDTDAETEAAFMEVFGTGNPIKEDMGTSRVYIGTAFIGPFVWHVYQRLA